MNEILVINPCGARKKNKKAKTKTPKKEIIQMAKRRRSRKAKTSVARTSTPKRRRRRNPSARSLAKRAGGAARRTFGGMNIISAVKSVPIAVLGMMAAKWSAKRFGEDLETSATETDPESWTGMSYLKGSIGAFVAGFIAQTIKPGWGQKVLEGGLMLMGFKLVENELVPKSEWASRQFGEEDQSSAAIQYDEQGTPYLLGENGQWYPVDERHRLPEAVSGLGDVLERPGALGDVLMRPGSLGSVDPWSLAYQGRGNESGDPFARAFHG